MKLRAVTLTVFMAFTLSVVVYPHLASNAAGPLSAHEPQSRQTRSRQTRRRPSGRTARSSAAQSARPKYSKFSHNIAKHKEQACDACHKFPTPNWNTVRKGDAAFPDVTEYPQHASCINCHRQQFYRSVKPVICSVCHVDVTPRGGPRHPFPNPPEMFDASPKGRDAYSEFQINFPHAQHEGLFGGIRPDAGEDSDSMFARVSFRHQDAAAQASESCAVCHQTYQPQGDSDNEFVTPPPKDLAEEDFWLKKGAFKTTPQSHAACFTCHSEDGGIKPAQTDCATCHKLLPPVAPRADFDAKLAAAMGITDKTMLEKWRRREAGRFRHEWFSHAELACTSCHNVAALNTLDEKTKKVPVISCGGAGMGCHIGEPDSVLNVAVEKKKADPNFRCTKCHVIFGLEPVPASHLEAVLKVKPK